MIIIIIIIIILLCLTYFYRYVSFHSILHMQRAVKTVAMLCIVERRIASVRGD
jgi:hypothetical protein